MSQWLRSSKADGIKLEVSEFTCEEKCPADSGGKLALAKTTECSLAADRPVKPAGHQAPRAAQTDPASIDYIVSMTRELKRIALKAGMARVALMLEMAELEASEQTKDGKS